MGASTNGAIGISNNAKDVLADLSEQHGGRMVDNVSAIVFAVAAMSPETRLSLIKRGDFIGNLYNVNPEILTPDGLDDKTVGKIVGTMLG